MASLFTSKDRQVLLAHQFIVSSGTVLLKGPVSYSDVGSNTTIVLRNLRVSKQHAAFYTLPKGRTEPGESLAQTALRETREETGYPCRLLRLQVRSNQPEVPAWNTEPLGIQTRYIAGAEPDSGIHKLVYFYAAVVDGEPGERSEEELDYEVTEMTLETAQSKLGHAEDREMVKELARVLERGPAPEEEKREGK
jgi:8-oxo-dGTP pyrophosphatase MutT (NUDIX family)